MDQSVTPPKELICRLCLEQSPTYFSLLFNSDAAKMLQALTAMIIPQDDEISTVICIQCTFHLRVAFDIQQFMLGAEQRFKEQENESTDNQSVVESVEIEDETVEETVKEKLVCDICGAIKPTRGALQAHKRRHIPRTKCTICRKMVKKEIFKQHLKLSHSVEELRAQRFFKQSEQHVCDICGKVKSTKSGLLAHKKCVHTPKKNCPICRKLVTEANFRVHLKTHNPVKKYSVCEICGAQVRHGLSAHMRRVHGNIQYNCRYCGKIFRVKLYRDTHENREHTGKANFMCEMCGKKFFANRHLTEHRKTHNEEKSYVCDVCDKKFATKYGVYLHKMRHGVRKRFQCEVCDEQFLQKTNLLKHLKRKHDIEEAKANECSECGKRFVTKQGLDSHFSVKHR